MNKRQLIERLAEEAGLSRTGAAGVVRALFDPESGLIAEVLRGGGSLGIRGFGRFGTRVRRGRRVRNPRTGRGLHLPAKRVCVFTPRTGLRASMKDMVGA